MLTTSLLAPALFLTLSIANAAAPGPVTQVVHRYALEARAGCFNDLGVAPGDSALVKAR